MCIDRNLTINPFNFLLKCTRNALYNTREQSRQSLEKYPNLPKFRNGGHFSSSLPNSW